MSADFFRYGYWPEGSIRKLIRRMPDLCATGYVLVRGIDSTHFESIDTVRRVFAPFLNLGVVRPFGLLLPSEDFVHRILPLRTFLTGFDELYLAGSLDWTPDQVPACRITSEAPITSWPGLTNGEAELDDLRRLMRSDTSILAIGDGCGVNYVTNDERISSRLDDIIATQAMQ